MTQEDQTKQMICGATHTCDRCSCAVYCTTYTWACPWINGDDNCECEKCMEVTAKEMQEAYDSQ